MDLGAYANAIVGGGSSTQLQSVAMDHGHGSWSSSTGGDDGRWTDSHLQLFLPAKSRGSISILNFFFPPNRGGPFLF